VSEDRGSPAGSITPGLSLTISGLHRTLGPDPCHYVDVARIAEDTGFDQVVLADHVVMGERTDRYPYGTFPFEPDEPWLEPLTMLSAIAAATSTVRLGTGILIVPLRGASLLAKTVATVDALSGGRVDLGVGVGWQPEEFAAAGVSFDRRWARLEDTLGACRALWADGPASFSSETVTFEGAWCRPRPDQARLPVWFGANATDRTARRIAALGDGWMPLSATSAEEIGAGVDLIADAYRAVGRDPAGLHVRTGLPLVRGEGGMDLGATMAAVDPLVEAGVTSFAVNLRRMAVPEDARPWLESVAERWRSR
jgi:probable F420-dependent oxidoreductase